MAQLEDKNSANVYIEGYVRYLHLRRVLTTI
jgi:hypothetical protein